MASLSTPAPRVKPARTIRLVLAPLPSSPGLVSITAGRRAADYFLSTGWLNPYATGAEHFSTWPQPPSFTR
jgi:hypothetical protein